MLQAENGRYTIIPVELLSVVLEVKEDGTVVHIGGSNDPKVTLEDTLNEVRRTIHLGIEERKRNSESLTRRWKKFNASKEFMDEDELKHYESYWKGFEFEKYSEHMAGVISRLNQSMFELTDFMLEHDIALRALEENGDDKPEVKQVSLSDVKNLFDNLGKSE